MPGVPVIDIAPFLHGGAADKAAVARRVRAACEEIGFLVIEGHGVPRLLIDRAFDVSRAFFAQDFEAKVIYAPADRAVPRGFSYSKHLARTIGMETPPDLREQFFVGPLEDLRPQFASYPAAGKFYDPNIWPHEPDEYRSIFSTYYRTLEALARDIMHVFALALDLPEAWFDDKIDRHFSTCPSNWYPSLNRPAEEGQLRCGEHTDFGSITILAMNDAPGGLQARLPDGRWYDVQPETDQLVVNLGDMMARWTNDRWRSTLHRVVNPPEETVGETTRQTIGFFLHPNYDAEIACIESCREAGVAPKYPPILAGEHMRWKLENR